MTKSETLIANAIQSFSAIHLEGEGIIVPYSMEKDTLGKMFVFYMKEDNSRGLCAVEDGIFREVG